jgi:DNA phosphorothioation-dependent restriction protein DptG
MSRRNFARRSGILIDVCEAHGVWFDKGERDRLIEFVELGGVLLSDVT